MLKEFKNFIMTGNVIDLAVAVILGGALTLVINGFVNDIMMPFVGHFAGGSNFEDFFYAMNGESYDSLEAAKESGSAIIAYGKWINAIINLVTVGFVLFIIVKAYNKTKKPKEEKKKDSGPSEIDLLKEIRDALKK